MEKRIQVGKDIIPQHAEPQTLQIDFRVFDFHRREEMRRRKMGIFIYITIGNSKFSVDQTS